ncbi:MAG: N-acetylmuramoyl-L-alanine amidase, partial [Alphaproteobacteria bacterium]|nr:N-acetylmuramoyl-L-alanine amidase [Alphaproteobacteria bacterium]
MKFVRLCSFIILFFVAATAVAKPVVEKIRVGQHGAKTRIVLEVTQSAKPSVFTLPNPSRVVLDFSNILFKPDLTSVLLPKNEKMLIQKMRQGVFKPGVVRMVLDVKAPVTPTVFSIPPSQQNKKYRIVIDLRPREVLGNKKSSKKVPSVAELTKQAPLAPVVRPKVPRRKQDPIIVMLDPGHGGVDPGAVGLKKSREKHIVLEIAKKLKKELERQKNVKVYLTRDKDEYVKLSERVKMAQRRNADVFISLHADAHKVRKVRGGSVYVLSERSSDKEAARLAREANDGDLFAGLDISKESKEVQNILIDLTQRETMNRSSALGQKVLKELGGVTKLRKGKVLFAGFRVLKAPDIPSILVELAYLSNPTEEKNLKSQRYQTRLARALAKGVSRYIN